MQLHVSNCPQHSSCSHRFGFFSILTTDRIVNSQAAPNIVNNFRVLYYQPAENFLGEDFFQFMITRGGAPQARIVERTTDSSTVPQWRREDKARYGNGYITKTDLIRQFNKAKRQEKTYPYDPWLETYGTNSNAEIVETLNHVGVISIRTKSCRIDTDSCAFDRLHTNKVIENYTMEQNNYLSSLYV